MPDLVRPLKLEEGADMDTYQTEVDESEDYVVAKGMAIEDGNAIIDRSPNGSIRFQDENNGIKTLRQIRNEAFYYVISLGS